jgi:head-tail adaptor
MDTTFMDGVVGSRVAALNISQWLARVVGVRAAQGGLCAVFVDTVRIWNRITLTRCAERMSSGSMALDIGG